RELLALTVAQARRISVIVERYDRMGRIELRTTLVHLDEVARDVARAHGIDAITTEGDGALECDADRDLLESAIDNVVRNAAEATREGGDVRVEVSRRGARLVVRVTDTGPGMDARRRDRAFDDFFTTKETGSGLGLAFARRVMLAHGGDVTLESAVGVGTTVELTLPSQPLTGATG
ncbi:MAG: HAMP domain-containing histidine kinase, partial [Myxococcales bacterium]|nr:HAMP domain-containing histidine kinase [Myxococcales bacterium]